MKKTLKENVLITGGGGFIGANLTRQLLELDYNVHLIWKKTSNPWRLLGIKDKINFHTVDLNDKASLTLLMEKLQPAAIFHLATYSAYRNQEDVEKIFDVSVNGTLNLLLASRNIPYKVFVNTGSSSEYGLKENSMKESDFLEPISFYAAAKAGATLLCQAFAYQYKKPIVTFRPFSVYGPYEENGRFIPTIIKRIIKKEPIQLTPGEQRRDFIYINDIVEAYIKSIEKGDNLLGKICNIGTGIEYTNDEVVKTLFSVTKLKVPIQKGTFPLRMWDTSHWVADIKQSKKLLNWIPDFSLEKGLKKTYDWFLENRNLYEK